MQKLYDHEMSLVDHLGELRVRLMVSIAAIFLGLILAFFFARPLLEFLTYPATQIKRDPGRQKILQLVVGDDHTLRIGNPEILEDPDLLARQTWEIVWPADPESGLPARSFRFGERLNQQFYYQSPLDPIMMQLKVALIAGILLALPIIIWQIWLFIEPGLTRKERKIVKPMLLTSIILFPIGACFAFFMVSFILRIMQMYQFDSISPLLDIYKYLSLLTTMMLVFGFIFELPLVVGLAARVGLVTPEKLKQSRQYAYVILAIAAAVLTPADPFSMLAAYIPLIILFEISLAISRPMASLHRRDQSELEADEAEVAADKRESGESEQ